MIARRLVISGISLAALIFVAAFLLNSFGPRSSTQQADGASSAPSVSPVPSGSQSSFAKVTPGSAGSAPGATPSPSAGKQRNTAGYDAGPRSTTKAGSAQSPSARSSSGGSAATPTHASEVRAPAANPEHTGLPQPAEPSLPRHLNVPLPPNASARGSLVGGFPSGIVPLASGSEVIASSVSSGKDVLQIALQAVTAQSMQNVLVYYRRQFVARGFAESATPLAAGTQGSEYTGSLGGISIVASRHGSDTSYSLFGTLHAAG